jgi:HSP20 family molecular chaperone IbpA
MSFPKYYLDKFKTFMLPIHNYTTFDKHEFNKTDDCYIYNIQVSGMTKDDVIVFIENNILTIQAEKKHPNTHFIANIRRSFNLPIDINPHNITAKVEHGLLTIIINKSTEDTTQFINVT